MIVIAVAVQDIIVVGASAGGVEALQTLVAGLPSDFGAAVFVVLHIGNNRSHLPEILTRAGPLPALHPSSGDPIANGNIYIAPPDCHLLVDSQHIRLSHGPKENRTRPAVNPLFRSAAHAYGSRVTGVILSGALDDGTAGLAEIKRKGGTAVVQDPRTAVFASMPENAIKCVDVDYVVELGEISNVLVDLTRGRLESNKSMEEGPLETVLSRLTCPECRGPLSEQRQGRIVEYRCRVGHAYSPLSLVQEHNETVERTLWSALVALEESADIANHLAIKSESRYGESLRKKREQIEDIKRMLEEHMTEQQSY